MSVWAKAWAYEQTTGSSGRKAVLVALAEFADYEGRCRPGQKTLAAMTELEDRTVRRHLAKLEEDGFIERTERRRQDGTRTSDETRLLAPPERLVPPEAHQPDNMSAGPSSTGQKRQDNRTKNTHQPDNMSGPIVIEPSGEPSERGENNVAILDEGTRKCVSLLQKTKGWKKNASESAALLRELSEKYPNADPVSVCDDLEYNVRNGVKAKNLPLTLRSYFRKADESSSGSGGNGSTGPPGSSHATSSIAGYRIFE